MQIITLKAHEAAPVNTAGLNTVHGKLPGTAVPIATVPTTSQEHPQRPSPAAMGDRQWAVSSGRRNQVRLQVLVQACLEIGTGALSKHTFTPHTHVPYEVLTSTRPI
jgi:hypothetical protein